MSVLILKVLYLVWFFKPLPYGEQDVPKQRGPHRIRSGNLPKEFGRDKFILFLKIVMINQTYWYCFIRNYFCKLYLTAPFLLSSVCTLSNLERQSVTLSSGSSSTDWLWDLGRSKLTHLNFVSESGILTCSVPAFHLNSSCLFFNPLQTIFYATTSPEVLKRQNPNCKVQSAFFSLFYLPPLCLIFGNDQFSHYVS